MIFCPLEVVSLSLWLPHSIIKHNVIFCFFLQGCYIFPGQAFNYEMILCCNCTTFFCKHTGFLVFNKLIYTRCMLGDFQLSHLLLLPNPRSCGHVNKTPPCPSTLLYLVPWSTESLFQNGSVKVLSMSPVVPPVAPCWRCILHGVTSGGCAVTCLHAGRL